MNNVKNNKGFTLAELLIVIAIIAALVAIMIPTFSGQIERAREATDAANIRAAYAEVVNKFLTDDTITLPYSQNVAAKQTKAGWDYGAPEIGGSAVVNNTSANGWKVEIDSTGAVKVTALS